MQSGGAMRRRVTCPVNGQGQGSAFVGRVAVLVLRTR